MNKLSAGDRSIAETFGPLFGLLYIGIGIVGFLVTGFDKFLANTPDAIVGFSVNPFHNVVHIAIGSFLLLMTTRFGTAVAEGVVMGTGLFYVVAFVIGVYAPDNLTIISMTGAGDLENINHLLNGVVLLSIGLVSSGQTQAKMKRQGLT